MKCPHCHSTEFRRNIPYEQGSSFLQTSKPVNRLGPTSAQLNGGASRGPQPGVNRPPVQPIAGWFHWVGWIVSFMSVLFLSVIAAALTSFWYFIPIFLVLGVPVLMFDIYIHRKHKKHSDGYEQSVRDWDASLVCLTCGKATLF